MRVELSTFAESDLEAIADYIAQENPARAVSFIQEIRQKFHAIGETPLIYRLRPEIGEDARLTSVGRHVILFRITNSEVRIERIAYGARDLPNVYDERTS